MVVLKSYVGKTGANFFFMFVEIQYVSTCAIAIGGESVANHAISHCKKMAKVRVSFSVACSFIPEDKNQA